MKKNIIFHDDFRAQGGGERLMCYIANILNCPIITSYRGKYRNINNVDIQCLKQGGSWVIATQLRRLVQYFLFMFFVKRDREKIAIFSWNQCLISAWKYWKNTKKILYCHSPPRDIFDLREYKKNEFLERKKWIFRYIFSFLWEIHSFTIRMIYVHSLKDIDHILTNSKCVQRRIQIFLKRKSQILYPPVDRKIFRPSPRKKIQDYYLYFWRISREKRVDIILEAFLKEKQKKLIITYRKSDSFFSEAYQKTRSCSNILWIENPEDKKLVNLISRAIATIYIPVQEDFWMVTIESMSVWTPVIWVNEGGLKETIKDGFNGILIKSEPSYKDLIKWLEKITQKNSINFRDNCFKTAQLFSLKNFEKKLLKILKL